MPICGSSSCFKSSDLCRIDFSLSMCRASNQSVFRTCLTSSRSLLIGRPLIREMSYSLVWVVTVLVASASIGDSEAARILGLFSLNGKSHFIMFEALFKGLAARGHQVYVVSHFPQEKAIPNYTDISVKGSMPGLVNNFTVKFAREFGQYFNIMKFFFQESTDFCHTMLDHPKTQALLNSSAKFDLVITEILGQDCHLGFSHRFNASLISMISSVNLPWGNDRIGNPDHPAYISNYFLPYTHHMNFGQRIINTVVNEVAKLGFYFFAEVIAEDRSKKYFGQDVPPLSELKKKTSLIFVNSHFTINNPRATVPGFVEVGGLHIQSDGKLPKDLKTYLDEAKDGVIYFSLGSLVKGETLPEEKIQTFISVFSELQQRVVWKADNISNLPSNVKTSSWLPQFEILSHPNVRAFITHGGLMGTQEAVHAGVPMVGIPLFADQELNIHTCVSKGIAVMVEYDSITKQSVASALEMVLHDPSYRMNAKHLSQLFRDRPHTPLETAIFWTEYVIRHGGAPHMRVAAVDLAWYQYLLLDVIAVILLGIVIVLGSLYIIFRRIISICCGRKLNKLKSS